MTHEPYTCIPARRGKKETVLCFALLILAALSFFFAARFPAGRAVGQLISVVLLLLFILISSKFLLTEYRYHLEDGTLSISLRQGSRVKQQGSIPLTADCRLLTRQEWKEKRGRYAVRQPFSYCRNLASPEAFVLLCPMENGWTALIFEPDETMTALIRETIAEAKREAREE